MSFVNYKSDVSDVLKLMVSDRLADITKDPVGSFVTVHGEFRSFNQHDENGRSRLLLSVFVKDMKFYEEAESLRVENVITLNGYVVKPTVYRTTPLGREIADIMIAVNRPYGKSDYIPCICWGRNARFASGFQVGDEISLSGRIQSREYKKRSSDEDFEVRIAYEVSASELSLIEK